MSGWPLFDFAAAPPYQQILEYTGDASSPTYIGWATPGVATSDAKWKIRKFTYDSSGRTTNIQYASGDVGFTQVWDNRASLVYK